MTILDSPFDVFRNEKKILSVVKLDKNYVEESNKEFCRTTYQIVKQIPSKLKLKAKHAPLEIWEIDFPITLLY